LATRYFTTKPMALVSLAKRSWGDSNPQPPDSKSGALSIAPQDLYWLKVSEQVVLVSWPSGLRRSTQVRVRPAGVGSNPTGTTIFCDQKCFRPGSNRRPWDYETHALPTAPRKQRMRHPGIEPGAPRWQRGILPLNQWRYSVGGVGVITTATVSGVVKKMLSTGVEPATLGL
jgi:hypothetical protein